MELKWALIQAHGTGCRHSTRSPVCCAQAAAQHKGPSGEVENRPAPNGVGDL